MSYTFCPVTTDVCVLVFFVFSHLLMSFTEQLMYIEPWWEARYIAYDACPAFCH